jgi:hypothetical protein
MRLATCFLFAPCCRYISCTMGAGPSAGNDSMPFSVARSLNWRFLVGSVFAVMAMFGSSQRPAAASYWCSHGHVLSRGCGIRCMQTVWSRYNLTVSKSTALFHSGSFWQDSFWLKRGCASGQVACQLEQNLIVVAPLRPLIMQGPRHAAFTFASEHLHTEACQHSSSTPSSPPLDAAAKRHAPSGTWPTPQQTVQGFNSTSEGISLPPSMTENSPVRSGTEDAVCCIRSACHNIVYSRYC